MKTRLLSSMLLILGLSSPVAADLFLIKSSEGPGFNDPKAVVDVLEKGILPTFDMLIGLQAKKKIVAAGLPVGSRTLYLIAEAESHEEIDRMLRNIPAWGVFSWEVTPLQSLEGRAKMEREIVKSLKSM